MCQRKHPKTADFLVKYIIRTFSGFFINFVFFWVRNFPLHKLNFPLRSSLRFPQISENFTNILVRCRNFQSINEYHTKILQRFNRDLQFTTALWPTFYSKVNKYNVPLFSCCNSIHSSSLPVLGGGGTPPPAASPSNVKIKAEPVSPPRAPDHLHRAPPAPAPQPAHLSGVIDGVYSKPNRGNFVNTISIIALSSLLHSGWVRFI